MFRNTDHYYRVPEKTKLHYKTEPQEGAGLFDTIKSTAKKVGKTIKKGIDVIDAVKTGEEGQDQLENNAVKTGEEGQDQLENNAVVDYKSSLPSVSDVVPKTSEEALDRLIDAIKYAQALAKKPTYPGENHNILRMPDKSFKRANFQGKPGPIKVEESVPLLVYVN